MEPEELKSKILEYIAFSHLWHRLNQLHNDEELNELMVKTIDAEEKVLSYFGLPFSFRYSEIMQFAAIKDDFRLKDIDELISSLEEEAGNYLSGPVLTDLQLLKRAYSEQLIIDEVFPEISLQLKPEPYYIFIYDNYFLNGSLRPEDLLEELHIIEANDLSLRLNKLGPDKSLIYNDEYMNLYDFGLRYLSLFIEQYKNGDTHLSEL